MSGTQHATDRDRAFFTALDRCHLAQDTGTYTRFSNYVEYRIGLQAANPDADQSLGCEASEMRMLLSGAALEWCGSPHHQGATLKLFSQIGTSYWASKLAIEHLSQFA